MVPTKFKRWIAVAVWSAAALLPMQARSADLLRRDGQHIQLTTDIAPAEADTIVATFDAAVDQWLQFWRLSPDRIAGWKVDAFVMRDKSRFESDGLIPPQVPDFPFGYTLQDQIWVRAQQSEYYTRHLVLHEGVHSLAYNAFRGAGPTWFQEGTAELLATHQGSRADVKINVIPTDRQSVPYWGRFKRMEQSRQEGTVPTLLAVMGYRPDLLGDVETYGWSWAAAMMISRYPEYHDILVNAARDGRMRGPRFNAQLRDSLRSQWPIVEARWRVMAHELDYGFDWSREQVDLSMNDPQWNGEPIKIRIAADQGWQSIGVRVPGRVRVHLSASGKVILDNQPKPWLSEPPGITFQYHRGRPLGQLLVCVLPNAIDPEATTVQPLEVHAVGTETTLAIENFSWLLFRVNDAVGRSSDNQGEYEVTIENATATR